MAQISATYLTTDTYETDFDLTKVFFWEIKYGILLVTPNEGDEEIEIEATISGTDDPCFKRPDHIFVDGVAYDGLGNLEVSK